MNKLIIESASMENISDVLNNEREKIIFKIKSKSHMIK